ncbi:hypothetical protein RCL1_008548 [Eukaryota sp. TZLM3-RCL]
MVAPIVLKDILSHVRSVICPVSVESLSGGDMLDAEKHFFSETPQELLSVLRQVPHTNFGSALPVPSQTSVEEVQLLTEELKCCLEEKAIVGRELTSCKDELDDCLDRKKSLETEVNRVDKKHAKALEAVKAEVLRLSDENHFLHEKIGQLSDENKLLHDNNIRQDEMIGQLSDENKLLHDNNIRQDEMIGQLSNENQFLHGEIQRLNGMIDALYGLVANLQSQLDELRNRK